MKIKSVYISNFKNFEGEHKFNLNESVNIFYAENGFGKSSFFDALEWCLTGEVDRYKEYDLFIDDDIINYNANEVDKCSVKIEFPSGSIERWFFVENLTKKGRTQVKVDLKDEQGKITTLNGKKYINNLIKNNQFIGIDSLTNIKQTHILSQNQITKFINAEEPKKRYQSVLSIMGLENKTLIDNLKDINKKLLQKISLFDGEIENYKKIECEFLSQKKVINVNILIDNIKKIDIDDINSIKIVNLLIENQAISDQYLRRNIKDKLKKDIITLQDQISILDKIDASKYSNLDNFIMSNEELLKKNTELKFNLKNKVNLIKSLQGKQNDLLKKEKYINTVIRARKELSNNYDELKKIKIVEEDIEKYQNINTYISLFEYTLKYKNKLDNKKVNLNKYLEEKNELELDIKDKNIKYNNIKNRIKTLEDNLNTSTAKELVEMMQGLAKIQTYISNQTELKTCPVCNSDVMKINLLIEIDKNIDNYNRLASKLDNIDKELFNSKDNLLKELELLEKELKIANKNLHLKKENIDIILDEVRMITESNLYKEDYFNNNLDIIKRNYEEKRKILDDIIIYKKIKRECSELENLYGDDLTLVDENTKDINDILVKLSQDIENNSKEILEMEQLEKKSECILEKNNQIIYKLNKSLLNNWYKLSIFDLKKEITNQINYLECKIRKIEYIFSGIEYYLHNREIDVKIKETIEAKEVCVQKKKLISDKVKKINLYIESLNNYSIQYIEKYLNSDNSLVKKYYNFLNPMPIKQTLYFNTNKEEEKLLIEINCNEKNIKKLANKTLSSGQLNVLALSIFVAMNENQRINNLDMIAIDDPIQNMDDINQFSVCDILGNIQKQIIFSTHDIEFLKLFLKKNSHRKGKIKIFNIMSPYLTVDKIKVIDNN